MNNSFHNFPPDLFPEVLSRLPAKALVKFKYVSKLWLSIIEDPKFRSIYTERQSTSCMTQVFLCKLNPKEKKLCEINWSGGIDGVVVKKFCPVPKVEFLRIVGSSNGVLCLICRIDDKIRIILWNPLSRHYQIMTRVPPRPNCYPVDLVDCGYGFGYDKVNDDYKILCFDKWRGTIRALVYSRKRNRWRTIDFGFTTRSGHPTGVPFGGALHWGYKSGHDCSLIVFNLATEEFSSYTVSVPEKAYYVDLFITRDGRVCMKMLMDKGVVDIRLMVNYEEWVDVRVKPERDDKPRTDVHPKSLIPIAYDVEEQSFICNGRVRTINGMVGCDCEVFPYIQTSELYK